MIIIICIGLTMLGFIMLSKTEEPTNEQIKHKCLYSTTCKYAPTCLDEEKESCFVERKIKNK